MSRRPTLRKAARRAFVELRFVATRAGFWLGARFPVRARVVLATTHASRLSGNLAYLAEELAAREPPIPVVVLAFGERHGVLGRIAFIAFAARAGYLLAASRVFVVDDYFLPLYLIRPRRGTVRVQVWHASGAFKRFGYSVLDKAFGADETFVRRVPIHSNYSLALVSSMSVAPHYAEAFGQPLSIFASRYGIPRTDLFFDSTRRTRALARIRDRYGLPDGRRVVLYAPTFRGDTVAAARYDDTLDLRVMHEVLGDQYALLLRLHPFVRRALEVPAELAAFALDVSDDPDLTELMLVGDVLVTDYSSAIYEFALLGRPIAFLAPDDDAYRRERGFYLAVPGDLPGPVFATTREVALAIRSDAFDLARVRAFAADAFDVVDGHATRRLVDEVLLPALRGIGPPTEGAGSAESRVLDGASVPPTIENRPSGEDLRDPATLRRLQLVQLEVLGEFSRLCDHLSLRWFVIGGTLLGAIRHGGFIPWDDDIDVGMPRPDYDRLEAWCARELDPAFGWQSARTDPGFPFAYGKLFRVDTRAVEPALAHLPIRHAIGIDIFPFDGAPGSRVGRLLHRMAVKVAVVALSARIGRTGARRHVAPLFRVIPRRWAIAMLEFLARHFPYATSPYVVNPSGAWGYERECQPRNRIETTVVVQFEGRPVPAPRRWHDYLTRVYGDYMQLPPPDERYGRHSLAVEALGDESRQP